MNICLINNLSLQHDSPQVFAFEFFVIKNYDPLVKREKKCKHKRKQKLRQTQTISARRFKQDIRNSDNCDQHCSTFGSFIF